MTREAAMSVARSVTARFAGTVAAGAAIALAAAGPHGAAGAFLQTREFGPRPTGTSALGGRVVHAAAPVARAVVTLDAGDGRGDRQTVTDDEGRFVFDRLPAGRFLLTASKTGWVTSYYGSARPGRPPGVRVAVEDGARASVEIPMIPGSVIAGRIVDEYGRPMARQWPWLLEYRTMGDRRVLARVRLPASVGSFERSTDDRGEFRLFGLPPGTYYLVVTPTIAAGARITTADEVRWAVQSEARGPAPPPGPVAGYASIYHPGTPDPSQAQPIVVGPGEARENVDVRVGFVPVARVAGVVTRPDGAPASRAVVVMTARESPVSLEGASRRATADVEGRFTFQGVPPGDYRLTVRAASSPAPPPSRGAAGAPPARPVARSSTPPSFDLWGEVTVVVSGHDVEGVGIGLAPASVISGRVVFNGTSFEPPDDATRIRLQFIATEALLAAMTGAGSGGALHTASVAADGSFRVDGLAPDRYVAAATWPGMRTGDGTAGWWLTTILVDGRDLGDGPIEVPSNANVGDVTIAFSDRIGAIEGVLTDAAGRPAPEHFVIAFPVERASWTPASRRMVPPVRPGTDGRFHLAGLLPGEYYLAVVTAVDQDEATDPAFLEAILPGAIRIAVPDGRTVQQDLRIGRE
jgi:hypothetical protein